jgi:SAM-dependent methyltransferase
VLSRLHLAKAALRTAEWARAAAYAASHRSAGEASGIPLPPALLRVLVAGTADPIQFLEGGARAASSMEANLSKCGYELEDLAPILDFGCGSGRVLRHFAELRVLHGADVNPKLVGWSKRHLPFASFTLVAPEPPTLYSHGQFGLIYALSVFTHLSRAYQNAWMHELTRILRPGGVLVFSTHGEYYVSRLTDAERARFSAGELVVRHEDSAGTNLCNAFHPSGYVRTALARELRLLAHVPEGALGNPRQDLYLFEKPSSR